MSGTSLTRATISQPSEIVTSGWPAKASGRKVLDGNLTMALRMPQGIGGGVQYGKGGKKGAAPVSGAAAKNMPAKQLPSTMAELAPDNENVPVDG